jgi:hypothetical protein
MGIHNGIIDIFIFDIGYFTFKVELNYTKSICTVYSETGKILMRRKNLSSIEMVELRHLIQKRHIDPTKVNPKDNNNYFGMMFL